MERSDDDGQEDTAAWDVAGAAFVPLLWAGPDDEESVVLAPGYTSAAEGTWTGESAGLAEAPQWATWRPNRSSVPGGQVSSGTLVLSGGPVSCGVSSSDEEPDEAAQGELAVNQESETDRPSRGIADLLVQEGDTWGSTTSEGTHGIV